MDLRWAWALLLAPLVSANPTGKELELVDKRASDPCVIDSGAPVINHLYGTDQCPSANDMNSQGVCVPFNRGNKCGAFCRNHTQFEYGTEMPVPNGWCSGPTSCTLTTTVTRTVTWGGNLGGSAGVGFSIFPSVALNLGINGGWSMSNAVATAQARADAVQLKDQWSCGYFSLVPVWRNSCGTYSFRHLPPLIGACTDDIWQVGWPQQYCARDIALNSDKSAYHKQIFVYTDCESGIPNKTGQNPIFDSPGVPLDRGLLAEYFAQWKKVPQGQQASGVSVSAWKDPSTEIPEPTPSKVSDATTSTSSKEPSSTAAKAAPTTTKADPTTTKPGCCVSISSTVTNNGNELITPTYSFFEFTNVPKASTSAMSSAISKGCAEYDSMDDLPSGVDLGFDLGEGAGCVSSALAGADLPNPTCVSWKSDPGCKWL